MCTFHSDLTTTRNKRIDFQENIIKSSYYQEIESIKKRVNKGGFYFHAKDDLPELRKDFFDFILTIDCTFDVIIGKKNIEVYQKKHNGKQTEFYADLLAHVVKDTFEEHEKLIFNLAERQSFTGFYN